MESILLFLQTVSPIGVIALLALVIFVLVKDSWGDRKRNLVIEDVGGNEDEITLLMLNSKLDKIADNHLHELPEMKQTLDRIEQKQNSQGERLASVEASIKILLK